MTSNANDAINVQVTKLQDMMVIDDNSFKIYKKTFQLLRKCTISSKGNNIVFYRHTCYLSFIPSFNHLIFTAIHIYNNLAKILMRKAV